MAEIEEQDCLQKKTENTCLLNQLNKQKLSQTIGNKLKKDEISKKKC